MQQNVRPSRWWLQALVMMLALAIAVFVFASAFVALDPFASDVTGGAPAPTEVQVPSPTP